MRGRSKYIDSSTVEAKIYGLILREGGLCRVAAKRGTTVLKAYMYFKNPTLE